MIEFIFTAAIVIIVVAAIVGTIVSREQARLRSMQETISGARSLAEATKWYPAEMHYEVIDIWHNKLGRD